MSLGEATAVSTAPLPDPRQLEIRDFGSYALIIDARSPREYANDHIPGAISLPVVNDSEYAEVGTRHKDDPHAAYLIGTQYALRNIASMVESLIVKYKPDDRILVYCFRGGKRSKLWADNLRTIGYQVDVVPGGWKSYRRWVMASLETLPRHFEYRVLSGSTGTGKTRLLHALSRISQQVLDLEALASHRGSLLGAVPYQPQPSQKLFDTLLLDALRKMDPARPVWVEAESKKIGNLQLPIGLFEAMIRSTPLHISAPMSERVRLWREDYAHFAKAPATLVELLTPLKPIIGGDELDRWRELAAQDQVDELFARVMSQHYDPSYERSTRRSYSTFPLSHRIDLDSLLPERLDKVAADLAARFG